MIIQGKVTDAKTKLPLENIAVSDGRSVVLTDGDGKYFIEAWDKAKLVYLCALTRGHDDWYFNLCEGKNNYDFSATLVKTEGDVSFFHNSDIEIEDRPVCDFNDFMRREVSKHNPTFYINGGDLARDEGIKRQYLIMNRETVGCPVRYCIGNHDFRGDDWGESMYEKYYGPTYYSFDAGDTHFVVLSLLSGDKPALYTHDDQAKWLKADLELLAKDKKVFVFSHSWVPKYEWKEDEEPQNPYVNLRNYRYTGCAVGHHHVNVIHEDEGVFYICTSRPDSGGIDSSHGAIRRVNITKDGLTSDMIYLTRPLTCDGEFEWETKISGMVEFSKPLIDGDRVYIATNDSGYPANCGIYALDFGSGEIIWSIPLKDGVRGSVVKQDSTLICQTTRGNLLFINAENGEIIRNVDSYESPTFFNVATPLIFGERVTAGKQMPISAVDIKTGEIIWSASMARASATPARTLYDKENNQIITGVNWTGTFALDADSGEVLWEQKEGRAVCFWSSTPYISEGILYNAGLYNVCKQSLRDGSILMNAGTNGARMDSSGAPADDGSTLYYPTGNFGVIALDKKTLERKAAYPASKNAIFTTPYICGGSLETVEGTPILKDNRLIFADNGGELRIYDKTTAELIRSVNLGEPTTASLSEKDGFVIAAGAFGSIKKIKI